MKENFPTGRAWVELDRAALLHNVDALRDLLPPGCRLMPAVKANAYGHGVVWVAQELNRAGVNAFCVATAQEGAELREHGVAGDILVLGYTHPTQIPLLRQYSLTQTVLDRAYAETLNTSDGETLAQVAIDTGMHRLGLPWDDLDQLTAVLSLPNFHVTGAFTHLCADTTMSPGDKAFTKEQGKRFSLAVDGLKKRGYSLPAVHILASYGLLNYPELGGDYARVGIALYGVLSGKSDHVKFPVDLWPVLSLKARVAQVRELKKGEGAGYDLQFTAKRRSRIAVLSIGYADGLPRSLSCGVGNVILQGRKAPIVGRICMDQTLADVTDIPGVSFGDETVFIGSSSGQEITACDMAEQAGTISNEILSRLGGRLERVVV